MDRKLQATSLIEVILYMGLLTAMIFSVGGFVQQTFSARNKQQSVIEVENEATMVMSLLERDLKEAASVSLPATGTVGSNLTYVKTGVPAYTRAYTLSSGVVLQTTTPGSAISLTSNRVVFSNFSFNHVSTNANYHIVTISFTAAYSNPGGRNDMSYQKTYRNSIVLRPNP